MTSKTHSCKYCKKIIKTGRGNLDSHQSVCYLNPSIMKFCPVCNNPIKNYKENTTCSYKCANTYFRSGLNNPHKQRALQEQSNYITVCFHYHKKECVVCGENKTVSVHHMNEDKQDNRPENLVPLCPTHHTYMHTKYKQDILPVVNSFIENFTKR